MEPQGCERHRWVRPRGRLEWERVSQILNGGAMPLDLLQERVQAWIKAQAAKLANFGAPPERGSFTHLLNLLQARVQNHLFRQWIFFRRSEDFSSLAINGFKQ
jgi:hypothetical protein